MFPWVFRGEYGEKIWTVSMRLPNTHPSQQPPSGLMEFNTGVEVKTVIPYITNSLSLLYVL
jgi:hypothetical protein